MNNSERDLEKRERQKEILDLVEHDSITTQRMLRERLGLRGIEVTQATLSRDIREMNLMKCVNGEGYKKRNVIPRHQISNKLFVLFSVVVKEFKVTGNIIVITCDPGMASSVCAIIDELKWSEIVGTIAGNDVIFVIAREGKADYLVEQFLML